MSEIVNIKKNIAWNTIGSVTYSICQWIITILVVYISTYEDAGYLSLAMTTSSSFSTIALFSMRNYQVSDVKGEYSQNEYVGSRITTCILAFVCCAIGAFFGNSLYQVLCIVSFMLVRIVEAFVDVLHGENQKFNKYDYIGKSYLLRGVLTAVSFSIGLFVTKDILITLFIMAICNLLVALLFDWRLTSKLETIKPVLFSKLVKELLIKCLPLVIFTFLLSLENLIPKNVLQQLLGTEQLGIYSTMASPTLIVQVFASVVFSPLLPEFSKVYYAEKFDEFRNKLRKVFFGLLIMAAGVTVLAMIFGRLGLRLLFGQSILEHYYMFMPIVWVTILTAFIWIISSLVIVIRRIKLLLIGMLIDFGICVAIVNPCILAFGKNGVSIVQIIVYALFVAYMVILCEVALSKDKRVKAKEFANEKVE